MPALPSPRRGWALHALGALLAVALIVLSTAGAEAQVRNLFVVEGVRVDETAGDAATAREQAMVKGERLAFEELLARITAPEDRARLGTTAPSAIVPLIKDFWISEEKASRVRYIAVLNYTFRPERVREFLRRSGVAFTTQPAPPAVVVPVLRAPAGPQLWEEDNPWRAAWAGETGTSLRPLRPVPAAEAPLLSVEQAIVGDGAALKGLAERLDVGEAIVAIAEIVPPPQPELPLELRLTLNRLDRQGQTATTEVTLRGRAGEDAGSLLKKGAKEAALVLDAAWKGQQRTTPRPVTVAAVDVGVGSLGEWLDIRKRLGRIDAIEGVNAVLYSRDRVRINLAYGSTPEDLATVLRGAGLALTTGPGDWTLRLDPLAAESLPAVAAPAGGTPPGTPANAPASVPAGTLGAGR